jgi:hypothetical protein
MVSSCGRKRQSGCQKWIRNAIDYTPEGWVGLNPEGFPKPSGFEVVIEGICFAKKTNRNKSGFSRHFIVHGDDNRMLNVGWQDRLGMAQVNPCGEGYRMASVLV